MLRLEFRQYQTKHFNWKNAIASNIFEMEVIILWLVNLFVFNSSIFLD